MLTEYVLKYVELGTHIVDVEKEFLAAFEGGDGNLNASERDNLRALLSKLTELCSNFNLVLAPQIIRRAETDLPRTQREFKQLMISVWTEVKGRQVLIIPDHRKKYYEWDAVVSERVAASFPRAYEEIKEAANCFALERYTSCVFHSMRAAEIGLRALGQHLNIKIRGGKDIEMAEWRELLDGLNTAIRDFENLPNDTPNKDADLGIFSEACAQFRFFKNGWRIRVAHARASYKETEAELVLDHIRPFFETISERLSEPL